MCNNNINLFLSFIIFFFLGELGKCRYTGESWNEIVPVMESKSQLPLVRYVPNLQQVNNDLNIAQKEKDNLVPGETKDHEIYKTDVTDQHEGNIFYNGELHKNYAWEDSGLESNEKDENLPAKNKPITALNYDRKIENFHVMSINNQDGVQFDVIKTKQPKTWAKSHERKNLQEHIRLKRFQNDNRDNYASKAEVKQKNAKNDKKEPKYVTLRAKGQQPRKIRPRQGVAQHVIKSDWPEYLQRAKINSEERSTRIIPMYLLQKQSIEKESKQTDDMEKILVGEEKLSPFSIKKYMDMLALKYIGYNISTEVIGRTVEYNDLVLVKMSYSLGTRFRTGEDDKYITEPPQKRIVFIVHALTVQGVNDLTCLSEKRQFEKLFTYYLAHLDIFDIFLIPMANPDGFAYSQVGYPWNKNKSPQSACPGVCLDRNFDVMWNSSNTGLNSCSQLYPGPHAFSEAETKAIRDVLHKYNNKIIAYIHVHAGSDDFSTFKGDAILYPKGYSEISSDDDKYVDLKGEIDEMMKNASFELLTITVDTLHSWYGKVTGTSVDYASTVYGIPYSMEFVMQLYDRNKMYANNMLPDYQALALEEIWQRVIDVVLPNIHSSLNTNE